MSFELTQDTKWPFEYRMATGCGLTLFKAYPDLPPSAEISRDDGFGYERLNDAESANKLQRDALNVMAASDDLLAVCERFAACMRRGDMPDFLELVNTLHDADAAIAKAKGGSQ